MPNKPIFYDADVLLCFLAINRVDVLKKLFSKIIVPSPVYHELISIEKYENISDMLDFLIDEKFVEIADFKFGSPEQTNFNLIRRGFWTDGTVIGKGEASAMAFAIENNGIVASNNLSDVVSICKDYGIPIVTSSIILAFCFEFELMKRTEIEELWQKILKDTQQILPKDTFEEYYNELFKKDCEKLLKNYDFKRHYHASKKRKKVKV